jgi:hypothetical protein
VRGSEDFKKEAKANLDETIEGGHSEKRCEK